MIRGKLVIWGPRSRPFVDAIFELAPPYAASFEIPLLVDTGADRTIIAPLDAIRLARELHTDLATLPRGDLSTGVGGEPETRTIEATLTLDTFSTPITVTILQPHPPLRAIPSLLGRDIVSRFTLILDQRTDRVLLLEPDEAAALNLP